MPRIRCHYGDCIHLESNLCGADSIELDPEMGCMTYAQEESEEIPHEEDWDEDLFEEEAEEEEEEWEDFDFDEEDEDEDEEKEEEW